MKKRELQNASTTKKELHRERRQQRAKKLAKSTNLYCNVQLQTHLEQEKQ